MRPFENQEKIKGQNESKNYKSSHFKGQRKLSHKNLSGRQNCRKSLRRYFTAATPGRATLLCVLTFVALKDTPLRVFYSTLAKNYQRARQYVPKPRRLGVTG